MGNMATICVEKGGSPDLETLFELKDDKNFDCSVHPSFRSCLHLWRFSTDKDDESRVRDLPMRISTLQTFSSKDCYVVIHIINKSTTTTTLTSTTTTNNNNNNNNNNHDNLFSKVANSSKEAFTPRGLALPFGRISTEPLVDCTTNSLRHLIYLWNGRESTDLTRAVALAKVLAIDKLLISDEKALRLLFSDSQKVSLADIFFNDVNTKETSSLEWNHLFHLSTQSSFTDNSLSSIEKITLPKISSALPIPICKTSNSVTNGTDERSPATSASAARRSTIQSSKPASSKNSTHSIPALTLPPRLDLSLPVTTTSAPAAASKPALKAGIQKMGISLNLAAVVTNSAPELLIPLAKKPTPISTTGEVATFNETEKERKTKKLEQFDIVCSEITPELYLGSQTVAMNKPLLKQVGITHILNCAGAMCSNYHPQDFSYKTLYLGDGNNEDISCMFYDVIDFIRDALNHSGKVYIHCQQGVSRSSAMMILFLMSKNGTDYQTTHLQVKAIRGVSNPNTGFMAQLLKWHRQMKEGLKGFKARLYRIGPHRSQSPNFIVMRSNGALTEDDSKKFKLTQLDSRGCFLLHTVECIFIWVGSACPAILTAAGPTWASRLQRYENASSNVVTVTQGSETAKFLEYFEGTNSKEIAHNPDYSEYSIAL